MKPALPRVGVEACCQGDVPCRRTRHLLVGSAGVTGAGVEESDSL